MHLTAADALSQAGCRLTGMYSICLSAEEAGDVVGGVTIGTRNAMAVDVQGGRRAGVAKTLCDRHHGNTMGEHLSCHEVP